MLKQLYWALFHFILLTMYTMQTIPVLEDQPNDDLMHTAG